MEDKQSHHPTGSLRSSWGEGRIKLTKKIFENFIPYSQAKERTVEDVSKAFHDKNQKFLKGAQTTSDPHPFLMSPRPQMPPRPTSWGLSAGRGPLKPIDDDWTKSSSKASYSAMDSSTSSGATSLEPSPLPPSGRKAFSLEQQIMRNLLTKARLNKASNKSSQMPSDYISWSDSDGTSTQSSRTYSDSGLTGYSGDDNWSLASSVTMEEFNNRQPVDKEREKKHVRKYFQELDNEHQLLMKQWKEEFDREHREPNAPISISEAFVFISHMPLTVKIVELMDCLFRQQH